MAVGLVCPNCRGWYEAKSKSSRCPGCGHVPGQTQAQANAPSRPAKRGFLEDGGTLTVTARSPRTGSDFSLKAKKPAEWRPHPLRKLPSILYGFGLFLALGAAIYGLATSNGWLFLGGVLGVVIPFVIDLVLTLRKGLSIR